MDIYLHEVECWVQNKLSLGSQAAYHEGI